MMLQKGDFKQSKADQIDRSKRFFGYLTIVDSLVFDF